MFLLLLPLINYIYKSLHFIGLWVYSVIRGTVAVKFPNSSDRSWADSFPFLGISGPICMMGRSWTDKSSQISSGGLKFCKSCRKRPQSGHLGKRVAGRGYLETFASTAGPGQPAWVWKPWFASARSKVLETQ